MLSLLKRLKSRLFTIIRSAKETLQPFAHFAWVFYNAFIADITESLKPWQPWFKRISNSVSAMGSFTSTLQTSFKITPIIISAITVLTAIPLFKLVFPSITISQPIITALIIAVAAIAAVRTYKEAVERDRLDKLIEENARVIATLTQQVNNLGSKLTNTQNTALAITPQTESAPAPAPAQQVRSLRSRQIPIPTEERIPTKNRRARSQRL